MRWRLEVFILRFVNYVVTLPERSLRFITCLFGIKKFYGRHKLIRRLAGAFLLLLDITPVPWLTECLLDCFKWKTRRMSHEEIEMAVDIFGISIPYRLCTFDPASCFVTRKITAAYTFLHTINFDHRLTSETMIHELVHVWQYHHLGSLYISEAIWAQRWGGGYNYGGYEALVKNKNLGLSAFNVEQQAEIVEDYFRSKNNIRLQWLPGSFSEPALLDGYVTEIHRKK